MRSVILDIDGPVHVADFGGSGPLLVLVHGLGGSHVNWLAVGPELARTHHVVAPDLIGFGRTPRAGRGVRLEDNRAMLSRLVTALGDGGPALICGNSMGGLIAGLVASAEPQRVAGLVLVDPALPRTRGTHFDRRVAAMFLVYATPGIGSGVVGRRAEMLGPERLVRGALAEWCIHDMRRVPADLIDAHVAAARERSAVTGSMAPFAGAARSLVAALARRTHTHRMLERVTCPVVIVHGTHDRLVPVAVARAAAARHSWSFRALDAGHTPQLETPGEFVAAVREWLASGGSTAAGADPPTNDRPSEA